MNNNNRHTHHMKQIDVDVSPHDNMLNFILNLTQVTFDLDLTQVILFARALFELTPMANYKAIHSTFQLGE